MLIEFAFRESEELESSAQIYKMGNNHNDGPDIRRLKASHLLRFLDNLLVINWEGAGRLGLLMMTDDMVQGMKFVCVFRRVLL